MNSPKDNFAAVSVTRQEIAECLNSRIEDEQQEGGNWTVLQFAMNDERLTPQICGDFATRFGVLLLDAANEGWNENDFYDAEVEMHYLFLKDRFNLNRVTEAEYRAP